MHCFQVICPLTIGLMSPLPAHEWPATILNFQDYLHTKGLPDSASATILKPMRSLAAPSCQQPKQHCFLSILHIPAKECYGTGRGVTLSQEQILLILHAAARQLHYDLIVTFHPRLLSASAAQLPLWGWHSVTGCSNVIWLDFQLSSRNWVPHCLHETSFDHHHKSRQWSNDLIIILCTYGTFLPTVEYPR